MKITVLLADDHTVVREGLKLLLNSADDIEVVGEVDDDVVVGASERVPPVDFGDRMRRRCKADGDDSSGEPQQCSGRSHDRIIPSGEFHDAASYQAFLIKSARHWLQSPNAARAAQLTKSTENLGGIATRGRLLLESVEPFPSSTDSITKGMSV
jgi:hypothetical protein